MRRQKNNGTRSSGRKRRGTIPEGPFTMNWSEYPDGPIPASMGLVDAHDVIPLRNDRMGINNGLLAITEYQGPTDQNFDYSGWRGAVYRDTKTLSDNVYGSGLVALHFNPASKHFAVASWYNPIGYLELGCIGRDQWDFSYLDATWHPPAVDWSTARIRSVGGYVMVEVDGEIWCGPVAIPEGLVGSTKHGSQLDTSGLSSEGVGEGPAGEIGFDDTPLGDRPAAEIVSSGTAVDTAASTTINVPYPSSFAAGDLLVAIVATKNAGSISAAGWSYRSASFGVAAGISIGIISKIATGSESGNLTITKSTSGVMAGIMYASRNLSPTQAFFATGVGNSSASTSAPSTVIQVLGVKRTALWVCAANTDTNVTLPNGWSSSSTGVSGSQAIRLVVGTVPLVEEGTFMNPLPYNAYSAEHMPIQTGTLGTSTTSAVGVLLFNPTIGII